MRLHNKLSKQEIVNQIKAGNDFWVGSPAERQIVLDVAFAREIKITTRASGTGYEVLFLRNGQFPPTGKPPVKGKHRRPMKSIRNGK